MNFKHLRPLLSGVNRTQLIVCGFCLIVLALLWAGVVFEIRSEREYVLERQQVANENLAKAFERHVVRTLAVASLTLKDVERLYRDEGERLDLVAYHRDRQPELEPYHLLSIVDENGEVLTRNIPLDRPFSIAHAENFRFHRGNPSSDVFVSKPRVGIETGKLTIYITRRMNKADGSYGGQVAIGMHPEYLSRFYEQIDLGADSIVMLVGRDGVARAIHGANSRVDAGAGLDLSRDPLFTEHLRQRREGSVRGVGPGDGAVRSYSYRAVPGFPLVMVVGTSEAWTLGLLAAHERIYLASAFAVSLLILMFAHLTVVQLRRQARAAELISRDIAVTRHAADAAGVFPCVWESGTDRLTWLVPPEPLLGPRPASGRYPEFRAMVHAEDRDRLLAEVSSVMAAQPPVSGGRKYEREIRLVRTDGEVRWVVARGSTLAKAPEKAKGLVGVVVDIDERKRTEDALRDSENLFKEFAENIPEIVWIRDVESQDFLYFNPQWKKITGWPPPRDRTDSLAHVHPDDLERARANVIAYPRGGADAEYRVVRPEGSLCWLSVRTFPVRNLVGEIYRVAGVAADITDRKHAELALRENERRLREAQRVARIGSWDIDLIGNRRIWSDEVFRILEIDQTRSGASREAFLAVVHPEDREAVANAYNALLRDRTPYDITHRLLMADGHVKFVHERGEATYDDRGRPLHLRGTVQDVTERVRAQQAVSYSMVRMRVLADRLVAVQEDERRRISRELHDEIGQQLTAAKIHLQAMPKLCARCKTEFSLVNLEEALSAVTRTLEQVRAMSLDLRPMQLDDLGLPAALRALLQRQAAATGWKVHFAADLSVERLVQSLELVLYRVAQEALTNVMRHARATEVWVSVRQSDGSIRLAIRDNGCGFDPAARRPSRQALGLGLLGMEERIGSVGGRIEVQSRPGGGTEVESIVPLPLKDLAETPADPGVPA